MNRNRPSKNLSRTNKLSITCKEATQFIVMNECEKLPLQKRAALWYHLLICKVCRMFQIQSVEINNAIKRNETEKSFQLSLEKKEEITNMLNKLS